MQPTRIYRFLSPQQRRLYPLLLSDIRMKEIAVQMNLDARTVDTHAIAVYRKCKVETRIGLIIQYYEELIRDQETRINPKRNQLLRD